MAKNKKSKKELERERQRKKTIMICSIAGAVVAVIAIILVIVLIAQNSGKSDDKQTSSTTVSAVSATQGNSTVNKESSVIKSSAPDISDPLDDSKEYIAEISVKDYGKITVKLDPKAAPRTVKNFATVQAVLRKIYTVNSKKTALIIRFLTQRALSLWQETALT